MGLKRSCVLSVLEMYKTANAGHIASSLSCMDILIYLHFCRMRAGDRFVLSKGHAAAALYAVLEKSGRITSDDLATFYKDGTLLAAHPPCGNKLPGITFGTGSLGHGLSLAAGMALSTKYTGKRFGVYCVLSDGDINEGSTWEAALFAAQHGLGNLTVVIDNNGLQGFGRSKDVLDMEPLVEKWRAFNFEVFEADNGNDFDSLHSCFSGIDAKAKPGRPKCVVARTVKGCGVSYMEDRMEWHYLPMDDEQYKNALTQVNKICVKSSLP